MILEQSNWRVTDSSCQQTTAKLTNISLQRAAVYAPLSIVTAVISALKHTGCFKKSNATLKAYINLFRGHLLCFYLS
jgi:hypothetical protein